MHRLLCYCVLSTMFSIHVAYSWGYEPKYRFVQAVASGSDEAPALNDINEFAYIGYSPAAGLSAGRTSADGTTVTIGTFPPNGSSSLISGPGINNSGHVSFMHGEFSFDSIPSPLGIYAGSGSALTIVGQGYFIPLDSSAISKQSISDDGTVVWTNQSSFSLSNGNGNTTEFSPPGDLKPRSANINASGQVAFLAMDPSFGTHLYLRETDGQTSLLADSSTILFSDFSINDLGQVIYSDAHSLFFVQKNSVPVLLQSVDANSYIVAESLNSHDDYAYIVANGINRTIYASLDEFGGSRAIISVGDSFLGSKLTSLTFGPLGLNDLGYLSFGYELENGEEGAALVRVVPETSTPILVAGALILLMAVHHRSRRRLDVLTHV